MIPHQAAFCKEDLRGADYIQHGRTGAIGGTRFTPNPLRGLQSGQLQPSVDICSSYSSGHVFVRQEEATKEVLCLTRNCSCGPAGGVDTTYADDVKLEGC